MNVVSTEQESTFTGYVGYSWTAMEPGFKSNSYLGLMPVIGIVH